MKPILSLIIALLIFQLSWSQNDTVNQLDSQGNKTGFWQKHYPNGQVQYEGYFLNNLPTGTLNRYYPSGVIKATLHRHPDSLLIHASIFDEKANLRVSGPYLNQSKEGIWFFYSESHDLVLKISYHQDLLDGVASRFYANGNLEETTNWHMNKLVGLQTLYNDQGRKTAEIDYFANQMNGSYRVFSTEGFIEINGRYAKGLKIGKWQYFKPGGELNYELIYEKGILKNSEVLDSLQRQSFELYESGKLILKDPLSYLSDPAEYFKK